jgi:hypothetical protein
MPIYLDPQKGYRAIAADKEEEYIKRYPTARKVTEETIRRARDFWETQGRDAWELQPHDYPVSEEDAQKNAQEMAKAKENEAAERAKGVFRYKLPHVEEGQGTPKRERMRDWSKVNKAFNGQPPNIDTPFEVQPFQPKSFDQVSTEVLNKQAHNPNFLPNQEARHAYEAENDTFWNTYFGDLAQRFGSGTQEIVGGLYSAADKAIGVHDDVFGGPSEGGTLISEILSAPPKAARKFIRESGRAALEHAEDLKKRSNRYVGGKGGGTGEVFLDAAESIPGSLLAMVPQIGAPLYFIQILNAKYDENAKNPLMSETLRWVNALNSALISTGVEKVGGEKILGILKSVWKNPATKQPIKGWIERTFGSVIADVAEVTGRVGQVSGIEALEEFVETPFQNLNDMGTGAAENDRGVFDGWLKNTVTGGAAGSFFAIPVLLGYMAHTPTRRRMRRQIKESTARFDASFDAGDAAYLNRIVDIAVATGDTRILERGLIGLRNSTKLDEEKKRIAEDYIKAKHTEQLMQKLKAEDAQKRRQEVTDVIDQHVNPTTNSIVTVQLYANDNDESNEPVELVSKIVFNPDGTVNREESDKQQIYIDPKTGKRMPISVDMIEKRVEVVPRAEAIEAVTKEREAPLVAEEENDAVRDYEIGETIRFTMGGQDQIGEIAGIDDAGNYIVNVETPDGFQPIPVEPRFIVNEDAIKGLQDGDVVNYRDENDVIHTGEVENIANTELRKQGLIDVSGVTVPISSVIPVSKPQETAADQAATSEVVPKNKVAQAPDQAAARANQEATATQPKTPITSGGPAVAAAPTGEAVAEIDRIKERAPRDEDGKVDYERLAVTNVDDYVALLKEDLGEEGMNEYLQSNAKGLGEKIAAKQKDKKGKIGNELIAVVKEIADLQKQKTIADWIVKSQEVAAAKSAAEATSTQTTTGQPEIVEEVTEDSTQTGVDPETVESATEDREHIERDNAEYEQYFEDERRQEEKDREERDRESTRLAAEKTISELEEDYAKAADADSEFRYKAHNKIIDLLDAMSKKFNSHKDNILSYSNAPYHLKVRYINGTIKDRRTIEEREKDKAAFKAAPEDFSKLEEAFSELQQDIETGRVLRLRERTAFDALLKAQETTEGNAETEQPNQIKSATDNTGAFDANNPDIRFQAESTERESANKRFNDELDKFANGEPMQELHLGKPLAKLQAAGIQPTEITITPRTLRKHLDNHNLTPEDLKGLAKAIQDPILVYEWGSKGKSTMVLTDLTTTDGLKLIVAIKLERKGQKLSVNEIAGVYGKSAERLKDDFKKSSPTELRDEKLKWVESQKVLDWLGMSPPKGAPSLTDPALKEIAKVIQDFQNPPLPETNSQGLTGDQNFKPISKKNLDKLVGRLKRVGFANEVVSDERFKKALKRVLAAKEINDRLGISENELVNFMWGRHTRAIRARANANIAAAAARLFNETKLKAIDGSIDALKLIERFKESPFYAKLALSSSAVVEAEDLINYGDDMLRFILDNLGIHYMADSEGVVYGFTEGKTVYLNPDLMNANTPIHEFAHLWVDFIKENNKALWERGKKLIEGSVYWDAVNNNPFYKNLSYDQKIDEAMAMAIGDKGEAVFHTQNILQIANLRNWLNEVWSWIGSKVGIRGLTSMQIEDMTLEQFTTGAVADLLSGEKIANFDSQMNESSTSNNNGTNNGRVENTLPEYRLTPDQAKVLVKEIESKADPVSRIELTQENWKREFGEEGKVTTPIGEVKMGANQFEKMDQKGRSGKLGMIKPTLTNPDFIIEDPSQAKEGTPTERNSSLMFVKAFNLEGEKGTQPFTSITVRRDGLEIVISNHPLKDSRLLKKLNTGGVVFVNEKFAPISSEWHLTENPKSLPDLLPTQEASFSSDKSNTDISNTQENESENNQVARFQASSPTPAPTTAEKEEIRSAEKNLAELRAELDKRTGGAWSMFRQHVQDKHIAVKRLLEKLRETGMKISDNDDLYLSATHIPGKIDARMNFFDKAYVKPMVDALRAVEKAAGVKFRDIENYGILKGAPQRNATLDARAAEEYKKGRQERKEEAEKTYMTKHANDQGTEAEKKARFEAMYEAETAKELAKKLAERPDNGIRAVMREIQGKKENEPLSKEQAAKDAEEYVAKFEEKAGKENIDRLWETVKKANDFSLEEAYKSGRITKETMENVKKQWGNYLPFRGHDAETAEKLYDYVPGTGTYFSPALISAKGRTSRPESPFAYIVTKAQSEIREGIENMWRQQLRRLAVQDKSGLLTTSEAWYVKTKSEPDGTPVYELQEAKWDEDPEQYQENIRIFEEQMKQKAEKGDAVRRRGKLNLGGIFITPKHAEQHTVKVYSGGRPYTVYINANPNIARAIMGANDEHVASKGAVGKLLQWNRSWLRLKSAFNTSFNPKFILTNLARDVMGAHIKAGVDEGAAYNWRLLKNRALGAPALFRHVIGKTDLRRETDKRLMDFVMNGGKTGYTQILELNTLQRQIENDIKNKGRITVGNAAKLILEPIIVLNEFIENSTRFATYLAAIESGKSVPRAITEAKDITVNFNRTGDQGGGAKYVGQAYMFANAAIQGADWLGGVTNRHPRKMAAIMTSMSVLGALPWLLLEAMGDDEQKEEYAAMSDYERQSNLIIPIPGGGFIKYPVPHELRPAHALGDNVFMLNLGRKTGEDVLKATLFSLTDILPVNPLSGVEAGTAQLLPDALGLITWGELETNKNFMGSPIYSEWADPHKPGYTRVRTNKKGETYTPSFIVDFIKGVDQATGGDSVEKGGLSLNPDQVHHVMSGIFGGFYRTVVQTAEALSKEEDGVEGLLEKGWGKTKGVGGVIGSSFYTSPDDIRLVNRFVNDRYREVSELVDESIRKSKEYGKLLDKGELSESAYAEKIASLNTEEAQDLKEGMKEVSRLEKQLKDLTDVEQKELEAVIADLKRDIVNAAKGKKINKTVVK